MLALRNAHHTGHTHTLASLAGVVEGQLLVLDECVALMVEAQVEMVVSAVVASAVVASVSVSAVAVAVASAVAAATVAVAEASVEVLVY